MATMNKIPSLPMKAWRCFFLALALAEAVLGPERNRRLIIDIENIPRKFDSFLFLTL